jgi:hypothetical protein
MPSVFDFADTAITLLPVLLGLVTVTLFTLRRAH